MKRTFTIAIMFVVAAFGIYGCEDMDDKISSTPGLEVENFVWKGLNLYYLWQPDVPDLADDRFGTQSQLDDFLRFSTSPEGLFQDLLFKPVSKFPVAEAVDRFSILVNDYTVLENLFQGVSKSNGVDFGLRYKQSGSNAVFGWVRYVLPGSDAEANNVQRGDIFYAIDGIPLNDVNYNELLSSDTYTLNFADYADGAITPNGESITLTKSELTENPVFEAKVIEVGSHKIAYLMYNGFTANFDTELNAAFGQFLAAGATDLVLDLRYNSGGSIQTATRLASMITGQFNGQLFAKQQWNPKLQAIFEADNPGNLVNNFTNSVNGAAINSLNLSKVYILTSRSTASASELVINGLKPYIDVDQIGDVTTGKNVGSVTLYDSPNFGKSGRSGKHKYAMQPLVLKTINKDGFGDYQNGLQPTLLLTEDLGDLAVLGQVTEPMLSTAIGRITANDRRIRQNPTIQFREFKDSKSITRFGTDMYVTPNM